MKRRFFTMITIKPNIFTALIIGYTIVQALSLIVHSVYVYAVYETLFIVLLVGAVIKVMRIKTTQNKNLFSAHFNKKLLVANLVLTVLYIVALYFTDGFTFLHPETGKINVLTWLVAYPMLHYILSLAVIKVSLFIGKKLQIQSC